MRYSFHAHRRGCSSCGTGLEGGFTLVEMIVTVAIMLLIVTPLASAMVIGFRVTDKSGASLQGSLNRDQATTRWAADVGSVDATGVSYTTTRACGANGPGTLYVNFNSTKLSSTAVTSVRRVSYWITGSGPDLAFERRECAGPLATLSLTDYRSTVVADQIGTDPTNNLSLIFPPNGSGTDPCTEFVCGVNISGRVSFELRAPRRAYGVGTPLEIGTLYSSAFTRQGGTDNSFRYVHYTTTGAAGLIEQKYNQQLSLAPGLGSSTEMAVDFKVKQLTTGKWLNRNVGTGKLEFTAALGPTSGWLAATYTASTEQWALTGITVGTDTDIDHQYDPLVPGTIDAGGEYRVYTRITEKSSSGGALTPKEYGGANGFPMWFDWRPDQVVFVSTTGNDANDGRVESNTALSTFGQPKPVKTIARALAVARDANAPGTPAVLDAPVPEILVQAGRYGGQVQVTTAKAADNTTIQGGLTTNWLRAGPMSRSVAPDTFPKYSFIDGTQVTAGTTPPIGMVVDGVKGLRIRQLEISSHLGVGTPPTPGTSPAGYSSYGMQAINEADLELQNSEVTGKAPPTYDGSTGAPVSGGVAPVACSGAQGGLHSSSTNTTWNASNWSSSLTYETDCTGGSTGDANSPISRRGGTGGRGGSWSGAILCLGGGGNGGSQGGGSGATPTGGGGAGGAGGPGGSTGSDPGDGQRGKSGVGGDGGTQAAQTFPTASATAWIPTAALKGGDGKPGGGGGGSGGGGANQCFNETGRSGSTGGNGGKGGTGGGGGRSGGSAFGLYIWGNSKVRIVGSGINAASGARGENGAQGGRGGYGGAGGAAYVSSAYGGDTAGAGGGGGGGGGAGGNGGDGGDSIAIFLGTGAPQPKGGNATATGVAETTFSAWNYLDVGGGGLKGTGGPVAAPGSSTDTQGGGPGGPGGVPASSCGICTSIFNFDIQIGYYSANSGESGGAGKGAVKGLDGQPGRRCHVWTWADGTGGTCTRTP